MDQYHHQVRTTPEITLPLAFERDADEPLPAQLAGSIRHLIGEGTLAPGDAVPSTRALAAHLGVSRGSVIAAYDQLLAEGYLSAAAGSSTVVNPLLERVHPRLPAAATASVATPSPTALDLSPGRPWQERVVGPAWKASWRRAASAPVAEPVPPSGLLSLRSALSEHLRRMRGVVRDPSSIVVTSGGKEGLALLLMALAAGERRPDLALAAGGWLPDGAGAANREWRRLRVGVEEPGYPSLRRVPPRLGAEVVPLRADEHGLLVSALPTGAAALDIVIVTPSHQYPLGGSLPIDRRQGLLAWARDHRVLVVEDDYDSELRYTSQPLPALAALDDPAMGCVVLLGTLSKTLSPAVGTGFVVLPEWLLSAVEAVRRDLGQPVNLVAQRAVADFLASGALRLHTQQMRNLYRRRRAQVVAALGGLDGVRVYPMDGGLHAVVEVDRDEGSLVDELAAAGVRLSALSRYWSTGGSRTGLVFGFGGVSDAELAQALGVIASHLGGKGSDERSHRPAAP